MLLKKYVRLSEHWEILTRKFHCAALWGRWAFSQAATR